MSEQPFDKSANKGLRHLINATRFSLEGLKSAYLFESAFRQELLLFAILLPTGAWFADNLLLFIALLSACLLVLAIELLNSGIEAAIDRVGTDHNEFAKLAKDYGSAAVMVSLLIVAIVWGYIFLSAFNFV